MNGAACSSVAPAATRRAFRRLPLLLVGGPAGAGKSTVGAALLGEVREAVIMESDLLWRREFDTPGDATTSTSVCGCVCARTWRRRARPVALFGAGFAVPHNFDAIPECAYFSALHFLALVCDDDVLGAASARGPSWRDTHGRVNRRTRQVQPLAQRERAPTAPPVTLIDTTGVPSTRRRRRSPRGFALAPASDR